MPTDIVPPLLDRSYLGQSLIGRRLRVVALLVCLPFSLILIRWFTVWYTLVYTIFIIDLIMVIINKLLFSQNFNKFLSRFILFHSNLYTIITYINYKHICNKCFIKNRILLKEDRNKNYPKINLYLLNS